MLWSLAYLIMYGNWMEKDLIFKINVLYYTKLIEDLDNILL